MNQILSSLFMEPKNIPFKLKSPLIGPDRIWFLILYHSIKNRIFYEEVNQ